MFAARYVSVFSIACELPTALALSADIAKRSYVHWTGLLLHSCSPSQSTPDDRKRKDGMRARREFDAQREFETSTALTVRLDR
jgi:hypothetical protein